MKEIWVKSGCSIVMYGWIDITKRPLINIIVTCINVPFFLKFVDCSRKHKDATFQFEPLREAIEEVGLENVMQVVTDITTICRSIGSLVQNRYRHIFWTNVTNIVDISATSRYIGNIAIYRDVNSLVIYRQYIAPIFSRFFSRFFPIFSRYLPILS